MTFELQRLRLLQELDGAWVPASWPMMPVLVGSFGSETECVICSYDAPIHAEKCGSVNHIPHTPQTRSPKSY